MEADTAMDNSKLEISSFERHYRFSSCAVIISGQLSSDVNRGSVFRTREGHLQDQEQVVICVQKKKKNLFLLNCSLTIKAFFFFQIIPIAPFQSRSLSSSTSSFPLL